MMMRRAGNPQKRVFDTFCFQYCSHTARRSGFKRKGQGHFAILIIIFHSRTGHDTTTYIPELLHGTWMNRFKSSRGTSNVQHLRQAKPCSLDGGKLD